MDFASLMSAQISKAKSPPNADAPRSKYLRRADLEAERQAKYAAEQAKAEAEREERIAKKRKLEEEEAEAARVREEKRRRLAEESKARRDAEEAEQERLRRKRLGLPERPPDGTDSKDGTPVPDGDDMPDDELQSKLRAMNEPVILFGESHSGRLRRYLTLTRRALTPKRTDTPIPTTITLLPESEMEVPSTLTVEVTRSKSALTHLYAQLASYFTLILSEWRTSLSLRSPGTKNSSLGQAAERTYRSVLTDLSPLFRQLESHTLSTSLLTPITQIVHAAQHRRYVAANDLYLQLAIGKAAWPIGVTMVGIHERSAREKLHEHGRRNNRDGSTGAAGDNREAHIMADEVTRKMLQSIKRCLSFAQTRWPPEDVSQMMG